MSTKLTTIETAQQLPELAALGESKMQSVLAEFAPLSEALKGFEAPYLEVIAKMEKEGVTPELAAQAKRARLDIRKVRTGIDKVRVDQKAYYLSAGRAVDAIAKLFIQDATALEDNLEKIETHHERIEKQRLQDLQTERETELRKYSADASTVGLCNMADDVWKAYIGAKMTEHAARVLAEKQAEIERIAAQVKADLQAERKSHLWPYWALIPMDDRDRDLTDYTDAEFVEYVESLKTKQAEIELEQERVRKENERLQAEAIEQERKAAEERAEAEAMIQAEREAREKERAEAEAKAQAEAAERDRLQAEKNAEIEAQRQKEREAAEAAIKAANEERAKEQAAAAAKQRELEAELKAKQDAERKAAADAEAKRIQKEKDDEAAKQAELNKGDAAKFADFVADLEALKTKYAFKSAANQKKYADAGTLLSKIIDHVSK